MGTIGTKMRVGRGNKEKEVKEGRQEEQGIRRTETSRALWIIYTFPVSFENKCIDLAILQMPL